MDFICLRRLTRAAASVCFFLLLFAQRSLHESDCSLRRHMLEWNGTVRDIMVMGVVAATDQVVSIPR